MAFLTLSRSMQIALFALFVAFSLKTFKLMHDNARLVVDEEFHVPQGLLYCNHTFDTWNPKVTTLPGLYMVTAAILGPLGLCSVYWLRFQNVVTSIVNCLLAYIYFTVEKRTIKNPFKRALASVNLALVPPLWFFSNFYYTDVLSLTFVLLVMISWVREEHVQASAFGMLAVITRQTNVVWVGMFALSYFVREVCCTGPHRRIQHRSNKEISMADIKYVLYNEILSFQAVRKLETKVLINVGVYLAVIISFCVFVYGNHGDIVVGDQGAHPVNLHLPQIFYFCAFCIAFGWPFFYESIGPWWRFMRNHKLLIVSIIGICELIVQKNTIVHPYLLADNRHYTFYIWRRFYGKILIYPFVPGFFFCSTLFLIAHKLSKDFLFAITFIPCAALVIVSQSMLELRYFIVPYILFRLRMKNTTLKQLAAEFFTYTLINLATIYVFNTKYIMWPEYDYPQRIIW